LEASSSGGGLGSGFGTGAASTCLSGVLEPGEGALASSAARARLLAGEAFIFEKSGAEGEVTVGIRGGVACEGVAWNVWLPELRGCCGRGGLVCT